MIRHLDLFSGIGGFSLAASWTGKVETVGFCEIDPWCRQVLAKNFPGVPQHDDITTLTGDALGRLGRIDLITGGFPCQPYSVAGKQRGDADDRALWPQMARVIAECRPAYVLGENVPGLIRLALDGVSADLETLGYTVRSIVVPAVAVDAPHRRDRLWILAAHTDRQGRSTAVADDDGARHRSTDDEVRAGWNSTQHGGEPVANAQGSTRRRITPGQAGLAPRGSEALPHTPGQRSPGPGTYYESRCPTTDSAWEASQPRNGSEPYSWPSEPGVGRVAHGIPRRVDRLRGLGNAIVPAVAYEILSVMLADEVAA